MRPMATIVMQATVTCMRSVYNTQFPVVSLWAQRSCACKEHIPHPTTDRQAGWSHWMWPSVETVFPSLGLCSSYCSFSNFLFNVALVCGRLTMRKKTEV